MNHEPVFDDEIFIKCEDIYDNFIDLYYNGIYKNRYDYLLEVLHKIENELNYLRVKGVSD